LRIASLKRKTIPKVAVLVMGLTAAVLVATINPAPAQAYPSRVAECIQCHGTGTVAGTVTAVPSTTTPAAGATYTVLITPPANAATTGNSGFWIANSTAAGVTGTTTGVYGGDVSPKPATYTATMTAPAAAGTYYYKVWADNGTTSDGVVNFKVYSITVAGAPVVVTTTTALAMAPTAVTAVAPAAKTLTATVTGLNAAGNVQFFNGTTSLGTSPVAAGTAALALTAIPTGIYSYHAVFTPTNAALFTSSTSGNLAFTVTAPVPAPTASFTASAISGTAPLAVTFADTSTGAPTSWLWTFGNGTTSNVQNPAAVTYTTAGTYDVTLIVSNANGAGAPVTQTITVTAPPVVVPTASFTASAISGIAPLAVTLTDTSTDAPTSWLWTFGDGSTSNVQNPAAVTYTTAGTYDVTLVVSNANGAGAPVTQTITVTDPAPVVIAPVISALSPANGAIGDTVTITGTGFGTLGTVMFGTTVLDYTSADGLSIDVVAPIDAHRTKVTVTPTDGDSADTASNSVIFKYDRIARVK